MKDKLKNLELKKLLQEFSYLELDKEFKDEFTNIYKPLFLKEVQNMKTPEHIENPPPPPPTEFNTSNGIPPLKESLEPNWLSNNISSIAFINYKYSFILSLVIVIICTTIHSTSIRTTTSSATRIAAST